MGGDETQKTGPVWVLMLANRSARVPGARETQFFNVVLTLGATRVGGIGVLVLVLAARAQVTLGVTLVVTFEVTLGVTFGVTFVGILALGGAIV